MKLTKSILALLFTAGITLPSILLTTSVNAHERRENYFSIYSSCMDRNNNHQWCENYAHNLKRRQQKSRRIRRRVFNRRRGVFRQKDCFYRHGTRYCPTEHRRVIHSHRKRPSKLKRILLSSLFDALSNRDRYYRVSRDQQYNRFYSRNRYIGPYESNRTYDENCYFVIDDAGRYHVFRAHNRAHVIH